MSRSTQALVGILALVYVAGSVFASNPAWWYGFVATVVASGVCVILVWRRGDVRMGHVLGLALLFRLAYVWLPPVLSDDAFRYVWDGILQTDGINPYRYTPDSAELSDYRGNGLYDQLNSPSYFSVYPPLSQLVFFAGAVLGGGDTLASFFAIKAVFVAMEIGAVLLLARMVDARTLLLYAWHPLVVIEVAGQVHTEAAAVCFVVLAIWLLQRRRSGWASVALAAAGWVKLYPFVLLPFVWRRLEWRAVWPALLAAALIAAPYAIPEAPLHVASSLRLYYSYFEFNAGPYYALKGMLWALTGLDWSGVLGPLLGGVFLYGLVRYYRRGRWRTRPTASVMLVVLGGYLLCATTVHPWYLLVVLPLAVLGSRPAWSWWWLSLASAGTYLRYVDGPYWAWVAAGWGGWLCLELWGRWDLVRRFTRRKFDRLLQRVQRRRARRKVDAISAWLPAGRAPLRVLDLGAAEGYVGEEVQRRRGAHVVLADVLDLNRTRLPHVVYDGDRLPFEDRSFDVTILYFVLHHCEKPEAVLHEALRVTGGCVIVAESTYRWKWEHWLLTHLDRLANRMRSGGRMNAQEAHLQFRKPEEWRALFESLGGMVDAEVRAYNPIHRRVYFSVGRFIA